MIDKHFSAQSKSLFSQRVKPFGSHALSITPSEGDPYGFSFRNYEGLPEIVQPLRMFVHTNRVRPRSGIVSEQVLLWNYTSERRFFSIEPSVGWKD